MAATLIEEVDHLGDRATVLGTLARLMSGEVEVWDSPDALEALGGLLGDPAMEAVVDRLRIQVPFDRERLRGQWIHWFDQARVPPYECSNRVQGAAGHTGPLADIAGFYRAFGMKVHGERPDHLVAELEFLAFVTMMEADALARGNDEEREVSAAAARKFLRDHLGGWVEAWAVRVEASVGEPPWTEVAMLIARVVERECRWRRVIPIETVAAFRADDVAFDEAAPEPECGSDLDPN